MSNKAIQHSDRFLTARLICREIGAKHSLASEIWKSESDGMVFSVNDTETAEAMKTLHKNGFYIEPTSAVALADMKKYVENKLPVYGKMVVVLSGHGLKATETINKLNAK